MAAPRQKTSDERKRVSIDEMVDILSHRPIATTRARGWSGVTVDLYRPLLVHSEKYPALDQSAVARLGVGLRKNRVLAPPARA
jgi:AraC family transcriptional regulator